MPWIKPVENLTSVGSYLKQRELRMVRAWFLSLPGDLAESPDFAALWIALRDVERRLNKGASVGVTEIDAVIVTAVSLGFSSRTEMK